MKKYLAETIGTFAMIFCGCGAMTINEITHGSITHVGIASVWGLIVMAMIYAFGATSGAHFNPAVSIGFATAKKFAWKEVPRYLIAQFLGAIIAIALLSFLFPESQFLGESTPMIDYPDYKAAILEFILTFILMIVIINISTGSKEIGVMAGIAVGGVILLEAMFAGPITKASMNPVRTIAPAIFTGHFNHVWFYILAHILGAISAVLSYNIFNHNTANTKSC
ncbi:aquaporin [Olleya sp. YS]|uniref:MIP/aquaporin family protein n=1 Tax=Olleya sp. YS TaxID=3028318 RepID=UPI002434250C|nr:aquaporin [Olleya sp. YS]WGD34829.1 aquaporin [Olleya sp. YS]